METVERAAGRGSSQRIPRCTPRLRNAHASGRSSLRPHTAASEALHRPIVTRTVREHLRLALPWRLAYLALEHNRGSARCIFCYPSSWDTAHARLATPRGTYLALPLALALGSSCNRSLSCAKRGPICVPSPSAAARRLPATWVCGHICALSTSRCGNPHPRAWICAISPAVQRQHFLPVTSAPGWRSCRLRFPTHAIGNMGLWTLPLMLMRDNCSIRADPVVHSATLSRPRCNH